MFSELTVLVCVMVTPCQCPPVEWVVCAGQRAVWPVLAPVNTPDTSSTDNSTILCPETPLHQVGTILMWWWLVWMIQIANKWIKPLDISGMVAIVRQEYSHGNRLFLHWLWLLTMEWMRRVAALFTLSSMKRCRYLQNPSLLLCCANLTCLRINFVHLFIHSR